MPQNKRESLIYSVMMCFTMVLWMSMYNVTLHMGGFSTEVLREGWLGFPIAVVFAFCMDWFVVSGPAKGVAFRFFVNRDSSVLKKVIVISTCMVVPMVIIMADWKPVSVPDSGTCCLSSGLPTFLKTLLWRCLSS